MGEAKRRGTFEQRYTEALAYGRKKKPKVERAKVDPFAGPNMGLMGAILAMHAIAKSRIRAGRKR